MNTIRSIRRNGASRSIDQLQHKQDTYGNNGHWGMYHLSHLYEFRKRVLSDYKKRTVNNTELGKWRSIEFELIMKSNRHFSEFIKFAIKNKYHEFVSLKGDNSILRDAHDDGSGVPREIVVSYPIGKEHIVRDI